MPSGSSPHSQHSRSSSRSHPNSNGSRRKKGRARKAKAAAGTKKQKNDARAVASAVREFAPVRNLFRVRPILMFIIGAAVVGLIAWSVAPAMLLTEARDGDPSLFLQGEDTVAAADFSERTGSGAPRWKRQRGVVLHKNVRLLKSAANMQRHVASTEAGTPMCGRIRLSRTQHESLVECLRTTVAAQRKKPHLNGSRYVYVTNNYVPECPTALVLPNATLSRSEVDGVLRGFRELDFGVIPRGAYRIVEGDTSLALARAGRRHLQFGFNNLKRVVEFFRVHVRAPAFAERLERAIADLRRLRTRNGFSNAGLVAIVPYWQRYALDGPVTELHTDNPVGTTLGPSLDIAITPLAQTADIASSVVALAYPLPLVRRITDPRFSSNSTFFVGRPCYDALKLIGNVYPANAFVIRNTDVVHAGPAAHARINQERLLISIRPFYASRPPP